MSGYLLLMSTVAAVVVLCYVSGSSATSIGKKYVVETLVVLDKASRERWEAQAKIAGNTVDEEVMSVMYEVNALYQSLAGRLQDVSIRLAGGEVRYLDYNIVPEEAFVTIGGQQKIDAEKLRDYFSNWTKDHYEGRDVAVFISGHDFIDKWIPGLSDWASMCNGGVAVISPRYDYGMVINIAKQIGYMLGLDKDGQGFAEECSTVDQFIMSAYLATPLSSPSEMYHFSECSEDYLGIMLDIKDCTSYTTNYVEISADRLGILVGAEETCRRRIGGGHVSRIEYKGHYNGICSELTCDSDLSITDSFEIQKDGYVFAFTPQGMQCGSGKSCYNGYCKSDKAAPDSWAASCPYGDTPRMLGNVTSCRQVASEGLCSMDVFQNICCDACGERTPVGSL